MNVFLLITLGVITLILGSFIGLYTSLLLHAGHSHTQWEQDYGEFKTTLGYIMSSNPAYAT